MPDGTDSQTIACRTHGCVDAGDCAPRIWPGSLAALAEHDPELVVRNASEEEGRLGREQGGEGCAGGLEEVRGLQEHTEWASRDVRRRREGG
eukprot:CAMPEP_0175306438 /NCGR_PEP_ID=MMETSP0093-20121207/64250_1 /TAXON_ID=311494 /ORGANISM="Alexandrium monilatum, Strain CCMP3105" /LENGTH=91 /DNA_ID=CAMNT_0016602877 /DNA_START=37 /DNA_END=309 /DNA_ORIENTATION=-